MVIQHVIYSEKPNAFSMILEAIYQFWAKIHRFGIGFNKVFMGFNTNYINSPWGPWGN